MQITDSQKGVVKEILRRVIPDRRVVAFGSRVNGNAKPFSDLDLAVFGTEPMPLELLGRLRDAFSESNLPFRVDLADMAAISDEFRQVIARRNEPV